MRRLAALVAILALVGVVLMPAQEIDVPTELTTEQESVFAEERLQVEIVGGSWNPQHGRSVSIRESEFFEIAGYEAEAEYLDSTERRVRGRLTVWGTVFTAGFALAATVWIVEATDASEGLSPRGIVFLASGSALTIAGGINWGIASRDLRRFYPVEVAVAVADEYNRWLIREIRTGRR